MLFADRVDAGRALAGGLAHLQHEDVVVLGLPRGGVPVAYEVAEALGSAARRHRGPQARGALPAGAGDGCDRRGRLRVLDRSLVAAARRHRSRAAGRRAQGTGESWSDGSRGSAGVAGGSTSTAGSRSSSTTGSRPGRRPGSPARWPGRSAPARVVLAVPVAPAGHGRGCVREADEVVCRLDAASVLRPSGSTTWTSRRPPTRRSSCSWTPRPAGPRPGEAGDGARLRPRRRGSRPTASSLDGHLHLPETRAGGGGLRPRQRQQPAQPPQPVRRRGAAARPGSARCCSTCSPPQEERDRGQRLRHRAARRPAGRRDRAGCGAARRRRGLPVGYFGASTGAGGGAVAAAEPARRRRRGRLARRPPGPRRRRGSATVRAPTLLIVGGEDRTRARPQPAGAWPCCAARPSWSSSRAPRTCSRSPAPSRRRRCWPRDWFVAHLLADPSVQTRKALR